MVSTHANNTTRHGTYMTTDKTQVNYCDLAVQDNFPIYMTGQSTRRNARNNDGTAAPTGDRTTTHAMTNTRGMTTRDDIRHVQLLAQTASRSKAR